MNPADNIPTSFLGLACDRSKKRSVCQDPIAISYCDWCGKAFARCLDHDGQAGVTRSLRAHCVLLHLPAKPEASR